MDGCDYRPGRDVYGSEVKAVSTRLKERVDNVGEDRVEERGCDYRIGRVGWRGQL